jgi:hypothetical protein
MLTSILVNLHVEHIMPVDWNKEAFDRLVLEQNAKELILALTTNHLTAGTETDLIAGKGNGLIMLLHGCVYCFVHPLTLLWVEPNILQGPRNWKDPNCRKVISIVHLRLARGLTKN